MICFDERLKNPVIKKLQPRSVQTDEGRVAPFFEMRPRISIKRRLSIRRLVGWLVRYDFVKLDEIPTLNEFKRNVGRSEEEGVTKRKESRGGGSDEEEGAARMKERRERKSYKERAQSHL